MRRRLIVFGTAFALFVSLVSVTWTIATHQAHENTEALLDFAVLDIHNTVSGAIDTMLGHVARTAVRHIGHAHMMSMEQMEAGARELDVDEVNSVTREGVIIASNDPHCLNVVMAGDPVMDEFMRLTNGVTATVSQPFRPHARNPEFRAKYLAAAFPGGDGFVQIGLSERRLARMLPDILSCIFDEWLLGETGFFLSADHATGVLVSNPSRHRDEARTLVEAGYDVFEASPHEVSADGRNRGTTFVQTLFGEKCYCRAFLLAGHRFVAALPEREFYGTRTALVSVLAVLLFLLLAAFASFIDRIFSDSERLRAFYRAEDDRRAKDMSIAKTIQSAALPAPLPENPFFRIDAAMQPARDVGGDFYDFFHLDATHVAFLVADVSGKGITAALYMMTAKTIMKNALLAVRDPAAALSQANTELCASNSANMFLTAWVGVLDLETGIVTCANAGHNPPVRLALRDAGGGRRAAGAPEFVRRKSGPVMAFMDGFEYRAFPLRLSPGDALFLYTDGVTEALDSRGELFGDARLIDALAAVPEPDPKTLCSVVRIAASAFSEGLPQADDVTVLAVRYMAAPRLFSRSFPPTQEGVSSASDFLDEVMSEENGTALPALAPTLHVILDEVCSNIVRHSCASGFEIDFEIAENPVVVKMSFSDDGAAYDPLAHIDPDTTLPAEERPIGGLGILMVKRMSDSVSYTRSHNRNVLVVEKRLAGG